MEVNKSQVISVHSFFDEQRVPFITNGLLESQFPLDSTLVA